MDSIHPNKAKAVRAALSRSAIAKAKYAECPNAFPVTAFRIFINDPYGRAHIFLTMFDEDNKNSSCMMLSRSCMKAMVKEFNEMEAASRVFDE